METVDRPKMPRDFLDKLIEIDDTIVYPVRRGSDMRLKRLLVKRLNPAKGTVTGLNADGRTVTLAKPGRSVIVEVD